MGVHIRDHSALCAGTLFDLNKLVCGVFQLAIFQYDFASICGTMSESYRGLGRNAGHTAENVAGEQQKCDGASILLDPTRLS